MLEGLKNTSLRKILTAVFEPFSYLIKEALVHVNRYELEEMLIKQWENLKGEEIRSKSTTLFS